MNKSGEKIDESEDTKTSFGKIVFFTFTKSVSFHSIYQRIFFSQLHV